MKTMAEWFNWGMDKYGTGLVGIEQAYKHSIKNKVCVDCLSPKNLVKHKGGIVLSSDYYLCEFCETWYKNFIGE